MNPVDADKCAARRIAKAGCVDALAIRRVRSDPEDTRVLTNDERVMRWRERAWKPGIGNAHDFQPRGQTDSACTTCAPTTARRLVAGRWADGEPQFYRHPLIAARNRRIMRRKMRRSIKALLDGKRQHWTR